MIIPVSIITTVYDLAKSAVLSASALSTSPISIATTAACCIAPNLKEGENLGKSRDEKYKAISDDLKSLAKKAGIEKISCRAHSEQTISHRGGTLSLGAPSLLLPKEALLTTGSANEFIEEFRFPIAYEMALISKNYDFVHTAFKVVEAVIVILAIQAVLSPFIALGLFIPLLLLYAISSRVIYQRADSQALDILQKAFGLSAIDAKMVARNALEAQQIINRRAYENSWKAKLSFCENGDERFSIARPSLSSRINKFIA